jgi:hypothetical protein
MTLENPSVDHRSTTPRARNQRSRITNLPHKPVIAATSTYGKRLRDVMEFYASALGGWAGLSDIAAASVRKAAELTVLAEQARHEALRNGCSDPDQLIRLENLAARAVRRLGINLRHEPAKLSTLQDYVRSKSVGVALP